jgi:hypothetical protein
MFLLVGFVKELLARCLICERYTASPIDRRGEKKRPVVMLITARRTNARFFQVKSVLTLRMCKFVEIIYNKKF